MSSPAPGSAHRCYTLGLRVLCAFVALVAISPATQLRAQATGQITGEVTHASSGAPVEAAQVFIQGSNLGTLTSANGRFLLLQVPAGTHELVVERLGFSTISQTVTVTAGGTASVSISLEEQAIGLDALVVTGEAGAARQREVGNAVSQLNLEDMVEPVSDVEEMMGARVAGAVITEASGQAGSGNQIRLRGINSVTMGNSPLLYVDGVRVRSEAYPKNYPPVGYSGRSGNVTASPLADINPEDIERIEVIKGSAATALYGTEASAGVIQIFTKRGSERGGTQFTASSTMSLRKMQKFGAEDYTYIDTDGSVLGNSDYLFMDRHWLRTGFGQDYSLSASGGLENTTYFLSGNFSDVEYPLPNDSERSVAIRGNLGFSPGSGMNIAWNTSYTKQHITNTPAGDNAQGVTLNAWRPTTSYTGTVPSLRETINDLLRFEIDTYIDHFTTGLTLSHLMGERFDQRLAIGYDRSYTEGRNYRPFGFRLQPAGVISDSRWVGEILTLDYSGSYTQPLGSSLETTFSAGGQIVETEETSVIGYAEQFPGPGDATVSSGAVSLAFEDRIRVINAGFFVQNRMGFQDKLFLTLGLRVDGNSAFGEGLGLQPYPKASVSYVISDESFWNADWGTMRLRAAYGQAGRAPGAFDAVRTWEPVKLSGSSAFLPQNLGNPELGPERTSELELGMTGSFLSNRVTVDFTYYNQTTTDALFPVRTAPSGGGWDSQLENVGELQNQGIELALDGTIIDRREWGWDLGLIVYTNKSELIDLGGAPEFSVGGGAYLRVGEPAPVLCGPRITNPNEFADPTYEEDYCWGASQPTTTITPSTSIRGPYGIRLSARGEFLGGHYIYDANTNGKIGRGEAFWGSCIEVNRLFSEGQLDQITAYNRNRCLQQYERNQTPMNRGDFFKLRDVSLRIPLSFWTTVDNPTLTISGRNMYKWLNSDWKVLDPEIGCNTGADCLVYSPQEHLPPPATYTFSLRFGF